MGYDLSAVSGINHLSPAGDCIPSMAFWCVEHAEYFTSLHVYVKQQLLTGGIYDLAG